MEIDKSGAVRTSSDLPPLGCFDLTIDGRQTHFCEGAQIASSVMTTSDDRDCIVMLSTIFISATEGRGIAITMDPHAARQMAASLLLAANKIEPIGAH